MTRYRPEDYLYVSARVRALENGLFGADQIRQLAEAKSEEELRAAIGCAELGADAVEEKLDELLREGFDTVRESLPDPTVIAFLQYPYDCHNLKVLLKCELRGADSTALLVPLGTLSKEELECGLDVCGERIPTHMRAAIDTARTTYAKNGDVQEVDLLLDRACFADMAESAAAVPFAARLVQMRADLTNLQMLLRVLRADMGETGRALLARAWVSGGSLEQSAFVELDDEDALCAALTNTPYADWAASTSTLSQAERRADDLLMREVRRAKYVPFGAEVPIAYLWGLETSVRNLRILQTGRAAGADRESIMERVRESYV